MNKNLKLRAIVWEIIVPQETALTDMEQTGWIMAHQFNQTFDTDYLFVNKFQHAYQ